MTGAGSGIGRACAIRLAEEGARVACGDVLKDRARAVADEIVEAGGTAAPFHVDVTDEPSVSTFYAGVSEHFGEVHVLVNNAGATWGEPLATFPESAWDKVLDLNLKSPFFLTRALLPMLEEAATADDPARVINVGSIDGLHVPPMSTYSYSASKAALHHLTRVLAKELGPRHVTVNAVAPGPFESKMMAATLEAFGDEIAARAPLGRIGRPDDMAGVVVYLSSRAGSYVTGSVIAVDGGIATTR